MNRIYKYRIASTPGPQSLDLPRGAQILSVQFQNGILNLWAIVNTEARLQTRYFEIHGTGVTLPPLDTMQHVATVQEPPYVWHIFERRTGDRID